MNHFCIELSNSSHYYFPGDVVEGKVIVKTEKAMVVKGVNLLIEGSGRAHWSLTETFTVNRTNQIEGKSKVVPMKYNRVVAYSENEKYISQRISLVEETEGTSTLPEGTSTFPFQFTLPDNCPSSFYTNFGYVSYFLEAEVKRPMLIRNHKTTMAFTVNGIFDLNTKPGANLPQEMEKVKLSNLLAFRSGQLKFVLRLPKSGYVPGENLDFSCEIVNDSNRKINAVKASLQQVTQFQTKLKKTVKRRVFCAVDGPIVHSGKHIVWQPESIEIPSLPPTALGGKCKVIDVQYFLRFEANISGLSKSLFGELPVMIGTKPFRISCESIEDHLQPPTSNSEERKQKELNVSCNSSQECMPLCPTE